MVGRTLYQAKEFVLYSMSIGVKEIWLFLGGKKSNMIMSKLY